MSVLVLSYYLSRDDYLLATYIRITVNGAMQFLSSLSQALATLLALSLAFLVFELESVQNARNRAFETFRLQMYRLLELTRSREPSAFNEFDLAVIGFLDKFAHVTLDDLPFPVRGSSEDDPWNQLTSEISDVSEKMHGNIGIPEIVYQRQAIVTLAIAEDALNQVTIQRVGAVVSILLVRSIVRIALVLAASLLLFTFGIKDLKGIVPDLSVPVLFTLSAGVLVTLLDVAERACFIYNSAIED